MGNQNLEAVRELIQSYDDVTLLEVLDLVSNEVKRRNELHVGIANLSDEEMFRNLRDLLHEISKVDISSVKSK